MKGGICGRMSRVRGERGEGEENGKGRMERGGARRDV